MPQNWAENEKSIWAAPTYVNLLLGSLCSINTKISDQIELGCAEFTFARVELSPVCFSDLNCVELTQVRVSSKF